MENQLFGSPFLFLYKYKYVGNKYEIQRHYKFFNSKTFKELS